MSKESAKSRLDSLVAGIMLLATGAFAAASLVSEASGTLGRSLAGWLVWALGRAAWLAPLLLVAAAIFTFWPGLWRRVGRGQRIGLLLTLLGGLAIGQLLAPSPAADGGRLVLPPLEYHPQEPPAAMPRALVQGSGALGAVLAWAIHLAVGRTGAWIVLPAVVLIGLLLVVGPAYARWLPVVRWGSLGCRRLVVAVGRGVAAVGRGAWELYGRLRDRSEPEERRRHEERRPRQSDERHEARPEGNTTNLEDTLEFAVRDLALEQERERERDHERGQEGQGSGGQEQRPGERLGLPLQRPLFPAVGVPLPAEGERTEGSRHGVPRVRTFRLPPTSLLSRPSRPLRGRKEVPLDQSQLLEEAFRSFGVQASVVAVHRGPTVTRYELQPAPGVKVSRIVGLADDIALALAAPGVRIEGPIPGKRAVGIEVSNPEPETVYFREVVESEAFQRSPSPLTLAIGKDLAGEPVVADLRKMIHLLIAGATGSGKSVCLNGLISSLLCKASPAEVRLLMIDPKRVELSTFDGIPHLITPVITDPKQAAVALRWAVREMEERYELFAAAGVRNIEGFNEALVRGELATRSHVARALPEAGPAAAGIKPAGMKTSGGTASGATTTGEGEVGGANEAPEVGGPAGTGKVYGAGKAAGGLEVGPTAIPAPVFPEHRRIPAGGGEEAAGREGAGEGEPIVFPPAPLPYLVVIIDELADLMLVAAADVEDAIWRLAQMARAAGIYLVIATQRPSVDVITGVIKANIPSRIAFAVSSQTDSRVILDQTGAERLLGRGDMLFFPVGASKPLRAQGALIYDRDVENLVEFWKRQAEPEYEVDVTKPVEEDEGIVAEPDDPLFDEAVRLVVEMGQASISLLQRRFRIGYSRAARLIDLMEQEGIIGPPQGSKPREILIGQRLGRTGESRRGG